MTIRLIDSIQRQSLRRTFVSIAAEVGLDEKTIRNVFHDGLVVQLTCPDGGLLRTPPYGL